MRRHVKIEETTKYAIQKRHLVNHANFDKADAKVKLGGLEKGGGIIGNSRIEAPKESQTSICGLGVCPNHLQNPSPKTKKCLARLTANTGAQPYNALGVEKHQLTP